VEYNFRSKAEFIEEDPNNKAEGPAHRLSVFLRVNDVLPHTYSAYAREGEGLTDAYRLLDVTPHGRQEDWADSPPGWPQQPTYG